MRKGFHGSYLGGHTILYADPLGGPSRSNKQKGSLIKWSNTHSDREDPTNVASSRLLLRAEVDRLKHVRPKLAQYGARSCHMIQYRKDLLEKAENLLGWAKKGFGEFAIATNLLMRHYDKFDLEEIAVAFNERGWRTYGGEKWNAALVGIFVQRFGTLYSRTKGKKSKPKLRKRTVNKK